MSKSRDVKAFEAVIPSAAQAPAPKGFKLPSQIPEGKRRPEMFRLLRSQKARDISFEAAVATCDIENQRLCKPPLTPDLLKYREWWDQPDDRLNVEGSDTALEDLFAFMQRMQRQPELGWHVPGLIPDEGICLWHGQPRDFKTLTALAVLLALAAGYDALGSPRFHVKRPVKVAYFTEEDPERLFAARIHWLTVKNPMPAPDFFFPFIRKSLNFDVAEDREYILRKLDQTGAEVAGFDPMRGFTAFSDKGPADLRPVALFLRRILNETPAKSLVLVHHDTKPLAVAPEGQQRSRSQQASGGGIFSISDCPVAFTKVDWNKVAVFPEDYKLSGDPKPFQVTFETDERNGVNGPQFGSWIRPMAITKDENDIADEVVAKKILRFLSANVGTWYSTVDVNAGARLKKDTARGVLKKLFEEKKVLFCTGDAAKALGRKTNANLWSGMVAEPEERSLL